VRKACRPGIHGCCCAVAGALLVRARALVPGRGQVTPCAGAWCCCFVWCRWGDKCVVCWCSIQRTAGCSLWPPQPVVSVTSLVICGHPAQRCGRSQHSTLVHPTINPHHTPSPSKAWRC
jgi:hypothetical protein